MAADRLMVGVSGVRGTIGGTLTPEVACQFGCAMATMLGAGSKVVVGRDTRASGPMIFSAVTAGLLAGGLDVIDLGVVSTPGVALMTRKLTADGGIVITASHNPVQYNGIKFFQSAGCGLTAAMADQLTKIWRSGQFALAGVDGLGSVSQDSTTSQSHVKAALKICNADAIAAAKFRVVVDSINGAGCDEARMLMAALGVEMVPLNGEPTGQFAHEPEPIEENLTSLGQAVLDHSADVGFAQDPDADRLALVDRTGRFLGEEYTLALAASQALRHRKGNLATNLVTSRMVDDVAAAAGVEVVRVPTGEANVVEAMMQQGCIFGGEGNGGVIDPRVVPIRDSLVGMTTILQYMAETGEGLAELAAALPRYVMLKTKMPCPAGRAGDVVELARSAFHQRAGAKLNDADGLRVDLSDGWLCVRASNTEPIMRIIAEASDRQTAEKLLAEVRSIADKVLAEG